MSGPIPASSSIEVAKEGLAPAVRPVPAASQSPAARAWRRFRRNRLGFVSLVIFCALVAASLLAELLSNDEPLLIRYQGTFYFPMVQEYSELSFGGDFPTAPDYHDPHIKKKITENDNWTLFTLNPYGPGTLSYYSKHPFPSPPRPKTTSAPTNAAVTCLLSFCTAFGLACCLAWCSRRSAL